MKQKSTDRATCTSSPTTGVPHDCDVVIYISAANCCIYCGTYYGTAYTATHTVAQHTLWHILWHTLWHMLWYSKQSKDCSCRHIIAGMQFLQRADSGSRALQSGWHACKGQGPQPVQPVCEGKFCVSQEEVCTWHPTQGDHAGSLLQLESTSGCI